MTRIRKRTVLITGGAGGIGRLMAEGFLEAGAARVVLWDLDRAALDAALADLSGKGGRVEGCPVDIGRADEVREAAVRVNREGPAVEILVNNAGIVVGKRFADHDGAEIERLIRINLLGAMHTTHAFLPAMVDRGEGHIVNVASAAGLMPNPRMSVYAASKWGVLGWSESLRLELEELGAELRVTTLTPSYIDTGLFAGVKAPILVPMLAPERVAREAVEAVSSNRILVRAPFMVRVLPFLRGVLPARVFDRLIGYGMRVYRSMDTFGGAD